MLLAALIMTLSAVNIFASRAQQSMSVNGRKNLKGSVKSVIKIENVSVDGWEAAIRGMRNPMNSWDKSDSWYGCTRGDYGHTELTRCSQRCIVDCSFCVGNNDLGLMKKLVAAGSDHSKFMRMINVTLDITAPLYWWKEADTYKVGTVRNSCSTMHKIAAKEFELDDFSHEHLSPRCKVTLEMTIDDLNISRAAYLDDGNKEWWWQMIQLLPSSYNQRATMQLNYAVLRNMYHARKEHKLDEWREFCKWIETLPHSELITAGKEHSHEC